MFFYLWMDVPCLACECTRPGSMEQEFMHSNAVFVGEVVSISRSKVEQKIRLRVDRYWKGKEQPYIEVASPLNERPCGIDFVQGRQYLVYAFENDAGNYVTNSCKRTQKRSDATADLQYLGEGSDQGYLSKIGKQSLGIGCTILFSLFAFQYVSARLK